LAGVGKHVSRKGGRGGKKHSPGWKTEVNIQEKSGGVVNKKSNRKNEKWGENSEQGWRSAPGTGTEKGEKLYGQKVERERETKRRDEKHEQKRWWNKKKRKEKDWSRGLNSGKGYSGGSETPPRKRPTSCKKEAMG